MSGRFRFDALAASDYPAVGDWVALEPSTAAPGTEDRAVIAAILPRRSAFTRSAADANRRTAGHLADEQVIAANVDVAFIVAGLDNDFNLRRLERYLAVAWSSSVTPVIVLNKADIADDLDGRLVAVEAIAPGVPVVVLSALTGDHLADLLPHLASGTTAVVLGSSGVGKSTLVNALLGEERQSTGAVREDDSRGRHTTTHRELFELPGGALLIDTPGIRSLEVAGADEGVEAAFDDIIELAATCRFSDCGHDGEPGCAIEAAVAAGTLSADRRGQPPEARTRAGPRGPQDRPAGPGRAQAQVADHPQGSRPTDAQQVRRRPMTGIAETTTPTVWLDLPDAPPVPGLRFRAFRDLSDYEPMSAVMCAAARADDIPWLPTRRPSADRERGRRRDLAARRHRLRRDRRRRRRGRGLRPGRPRRRADL